jgi:L-seryl-tRNA(Ser) seleniumtransferase
MVSLLDNFERQLLLREIPQVNYMLENNDVKKISEKFGRKIVVEKIRIVIEEFRKSPITMTRKEIEQFIIKRLYEILEAEENMGLNKVINATGIVLHTNLGRAPLPKIAIDNIIKVAEGYSNLEYDLSKGTRGSRYSHIEPILKKITGAEAAMVVNNNAAAVFLSLNTLAMDKEVIISR